MCKASEILDELIDGIEADIDFSPVYDALDSLEQKASEQERVLRQLQDEMRELGFADHDAPVSGSDAVDMLIVVWQQLERLLPVNRWENG